MTEYITTRSGMHFDPRNPEMDKIEIRDIAHALSLVCRGNGQVKQFFSVAQHCIWCAAEARARGYSIAVQLACLLHDAGEAYLSDVPSPVKQYLKGYTEYEDAIMALIYIKYIGRELTEKEQNQVKQIDHELLKYDLYYLLEEGTAEELPELRCGMDYCVKAFEKVEEEYLHVFDALRLQKAE